MLICGERVTGTEIGNNEGHGQHTHTQTNLAEREFHAVLVEQPQALVELHRGVQRAADDRRTALDADLDALRLDLHTEHLGGDASRNRDADGDLLQCLCPRILLGPAAVARQLGAWRVVFALVTVGRSSLAFR